MSLKGCCAVLKYVLLIVNLIFWLAGIAVLALSIWLLVDGSSYPNMTQRAADYYTGTYILLVTGAVMTIIGFLGCCGALKESQCMLVTFFSLLLIILVAQLAAGVWAYVHRDELETMLRESLDHAVKEEYSYDSVKREAFDQIQEHLECCGSKGPVDWMSSSFNNGTTHLSVNMTISSGVREYQVPASCCIGGPKAKACEEGRKNPPLSLSKDIYGEGCAKKLVDLLHDHMNYIIGIGIGVGVLELLGMIFSMILCCAVRNVDRYKA